MPHHQNRSLQSISANPRNQVCALGFQGVDPVIDTFLIQHTFHVFDNQRFVSRWIRRIDLDEVNEMLDRLFPNLLPVNQVRLLRICSCRATQKYQSTDYSHFFFAADLV